MDGTMSERRFTSGMLVFPNLTQLDLTGPYEVLARLPGAETLLLWKNLDSVHSEHGLTLLPMATIAAPGPRVTRGSILLVSRVGPRMPGRCRPAPLKTADNTGASCPRGRSSCNRSARCN